MSILWVLLTHCIPYDIQDEILFSLWGVQAVPIFLTIQVFHAYKKGLSTTKVIFLKLWRRIVKPFLIAQAIIYLMYAGFGVLSHVSIGEQTIKFIKSGGVGPGSYYFWIYFQFTFLLPLVAIILKRFNIWANLIFLAIISELLEILCCTLQIEEWIYRLLFFRYFFLIFIGLYLVYNKINFSIKTFVLAVLSAMTILLFQYGNVNFEPFIFNSDWKTQHWITYCYVLFLVGMLVQLYKLSCESFLSKLLIICGKFSYEIFLWQMIYFCIPIQPVLANILGDNEATILYIVLSLFVCTIPILYVKSKNDFINIWNTRK